MKGIIFVGWLEFDLPSGYNIGPSTQTLIEKRVVIFVKSHKFIYFCYS